MERAFRILGPLEVELDGHVLVLGERRERAREVAFVSRRVGNPQANPQWGFSWISSGCARPRGATAAP